MPLVDVEFEATDLFQDSHKKLSFQQEPDQKRRPWEQERLHHLDWLRLLLVMAVVYAHTVKSGISNDGGFSEAWLIDDRTLFDHKDYVDLYSHLKTQCPDGLVSSECASRQHAPDEQPPRVGGRAPLAVRYMTVARQSLLPLLFWVSGASVACSYRGGAPRGLPKLAGFTFLGMAFNATLWFLGPMDPKCFVGNPECDGQGVVFSFTIVPWAGAVFAILFQMWYTVMLGGFCIVNWPFLALVYGSLGRLWALGLQWSITMAVYVFFLFLAEGLSVSGLSRHGELIGLLGVTEAAFLAPVPLISPGFEECERPRWLPVRAVHYFMAVAAVAQFGSLPFSDHMESIGATYILYMAVGFNRFFNLGVVMTASQLGADEDQAAPLLSRAWPVALIVFIAAAPSTNWDLAGMLSYPYFLNVTDRVLYVTGAMALTFLMDRCSCCMKCDPLPGFLGQTSLVLYLFHPVFITVLLHFGMRSVLQVWYAIFCIAVAISVALEWVLVPAQPKGAQESSSSDDED